ncbi:MAG TPA: BamA/TamA family outer membrane protein [Polyangiaceae bacterium]|nr:BamA/TamA family outer membrane protein [Polyangiaceae bacterium]
MKISGNDALDDDEIEAKMATHETPRFLGLIPGVIYDYEIFNRYVLEKDLQRIERYYRARGYYRARARAARVVYSGKSARVTIVIEEGPPVLVRRLDIRGIEGLNETLRSRALAAVRAELPLEEPFEEEAYIKAQDRLRAVLLDYGYASAQIRAGAEVDLPRNQASVGFRVIPHEPARIGEITIEGLGKGLPEDRVRSALGIEPGDLYSQTDLEEAKRALLDLGVFGSVIIDPEPTKRDRLGRVPIRVRVEPSKLRSVHVGLGVGVDSTRTETHVTLGWEDQNFLGGMRKFLVEIVPGVVLYPTRLPGFEKPERLLPQGRIRSEFRQPGFIEYRTNAVVRGQASVYPLLLSGERDPDLPIVGNEDLRASVGLERSYWHLYGLVSQNFQAVRPFVYVGERDPDLGPVYISFPEFFGTLDLRDSRVKPHRGAYASVDFQVAGLGGDAQDVKLQPELRGYVPLGRRLTLAARATTGLLFPQNYGDTVLPNALDGTSGGASRADWVRDVQIMFLRGFFSGGNGSNRGYGTREIGPHGVVPFYNPGQSEADILTTCDPTNPEYSPAACDLPLGGFTLWEASLELRYPLFGALSGTVFGDMSDVAPETLQYRFNYPHLSVGAGLRYDTPVGPIRFDLGFRVPGAQSPGTPDEIGQPSEMLGLPIAISLGIGESF